LAFILLFLASGLTIKKRCQVSGIQVYHNNALGLRFEVGGGKLKDKD
jgi:hypothetical protein